MYSAFFLQWSQFRQVERFAVKYNPHKDAKNEVIKAQTKTDCQRALSNDSPNLPFGYQGVPFSHPSFVASVASVFGKLDNNTGLAIRPPIVTLEALAFFSYKVCVTSILALIKHCSFLYFPPLQIRNVLLDPFSPPGGAHAPFILAEKTRIEAIGDAFGWERITAIQIWGKNLAR